MKHVALSAALAALSLAQAPEPEKRLEFEVASIRQAKPDNGHDTSTDKGRFRTHNVTLKRLIALGYHVDMTEIFGGPAWVDSDGYDINAKIPEEMAQNRTPDMVSKMVESLLADRFQLVIHREPRQIPGFVLMVAKKGVKMKSADPDAKDFNIEAHNRHLKAGGVTMENFAQHLSRNRDIAKVVVDKTGLTGRFDFELDWVPDALQSKAESSSVDGPSIFTALQERLGLKLEAAKIPVQAIVIDRAEKPAEN